MKKALLIADKQSLADAIKEGYSHHPSPQYDITYCSCNGHIMELYYPHEYYSEWKEWNPDMLPMIPKKFRYNVIPKERTRYNRIKNEINSGKYDVIINAGDPGREGELIITEVLQSLNCKLPELRLWTEDLTSNGICNAFNNILPAQNNLKKSSLLRQWRDWLIGMNGSRAATLSTGVHIAVGRVMTATLAMIVKRDMQRYQFVPEPYFECEFTISNGKHDFTGKILKSHEEVKFKNKDEILELLDIGDNKGTVLSIVNESKTTTPPLLLNLPDLQREAFSEYGYSPDKVLKAAQSLYEKKLLSYPKTESRYISEYVASELEDNLRALSTIREFSKDISRIVSNVSTLSKICKQKNKFVNNEKLTDHHALITTKVRADIDSLPHIEHNIYMLVARRVVAMFMPNRITEKQTVICQFGKLTTITEGKIVSQEGYSKFIPVRTNDKPLPILKEGDTLSCNNVSIVEKSTKPPSFYNFKTLLEDMENCGKFAESKNNATTLKRFNGLGQAATRSDMINKLLSLDYVRVEGKGYRSHLESTENGRYIYNLLKDTELVKVDATALMESQLDEVQRGKYDANQSYKEMIEDTIIITEQLKKLPKASENITLKSITPDNNTKLICPMCGKDIFEGKETYYCAGKKDGSCKYVMKKVLCEATINRDEFASMLGGNRITKRFKWSNGKSSSASLGIVDNQYKFYF